MRAQTFWRAIVAISLLVAFAAARTENPLPLRKWTVEGVERQALVSVPATASTKPTPVLFVFHGHGGTAEFMAYQNPYHLLWPDAIVVYPQGLPTPGQLTDPQGLRNGWQSAPGGQGDRDLKFFDAMLESLRHDYKIDDRRIYVTGHSNGGAFTYLLWATRGDTLAAVAPTSAAAPRLLRQFMPKPAFIAGGQNDPLVKFAWQQATIDAVLALDQCGPGQPQQKYETLYPSKTGHPVMTYIHPGGHAVPAETAALIVKFLRAQTKG